MKAEEVKFLLSVVRPDGEDLDDPNLHEALRRVETDEELREWFRLQRKWDKEFARKLRAIKVPEGLRDRILCGVQQTMPMREERVAWQILGRSRAGRRAWIPLAAAALVMLGLVVGISEWFGKSGQVEQLVEGLSADGVGVGVSGDVPSPFAEWQLTALEMVRGLEDGSLSGRKDGEALENPGQWLSKYLGCKDESVAFDFSGLKAQSQYYLENCPDRLSVVCLESGGNLMHLVAISGVKDCFACPEGRGIEVRSDHNWQTITWHADGNTYMLVLHAGSVESPDVLRGRIMIADGGL